MTRPEYTCPTVSSWRTVTSRGATITDANSIVTSLTDNGDGSWTAVLDDSYASTDPADGAIIAVPLLDPAGVAWDDFRSMEWSVMGTSHPTDGSDVAVVAGVNPDGTFGSEYFYGGVDYSSAVGPSRVSGVTGSWSVLGENADNAGAFGAVYARRLAGAAASSAYAGRVASMRADGTRSGDQSLTPGSASAWPAPHFFVSIMRTATGGGTESITFIPAYSTLMRGSIPGVT